MDDRLCSRDMLGETRWLRECIGLGERMWVSVDALGGRGLAEGCLSVADMYVVDGERLSSLDIDTGDILGGVQRSVYDMLGLFAHGSGTAGLKFKGLSLLCVTGLSFLDILDMDERLGRCGLTCPDEYGEPDPGESLRGERKAKGSVSTDAIDDGLGLVIDCGGLSGVPLTFER